MVTVKDASINFEHLKVFHKDEELYSEEEKYNELIKGLLDDFIQRPDLPLPTMPYPMMNVCLGLDANSPSIEILEGFLRIALRFDIEEAILSCLFG